MSRKRESTIFTSSTQKIISFCVLFFFLFNITVHIPLSFFPGVFANDTKYYDIVAILASESIYDDLDGEISRYAKDIQGVLPNTRALIIPTPDDASSFEVASLLEGLYYEGHKNIDTDIDYDSRLVGTVLVGDIPLPIVHREDSFSKTILPYVDFKDKLYSYSHDTEKYELSLQNKNGISAEIWHGVISPNPDILDEEELEISAKEIYEIKVDQLRQYFDKNHDFYTGQGLFDVEKGAISGKLSDSLDTEYEPHIFYYNQAVEQKAISKERYRAYNAWLQNREDINYNRFSAKLLDRISALALGDQDKEITDLLSKVAPALSGKYENKTATHSGNGSGAISPGSGGSNSDVQSMRIILASIKKYIEIFNGSTISDFAKNGLYSGRYGSDDEVRVDTIPKLVTLMDEAAVNIIRGANNDLEKYLDDKITHDWSVSTWIPITYDRTTTTYGATSDGDDGDDGSSSEDEESEEETEEERKVSSCNSKVYTHFGYGRQGLTIGSLDECSIYRGSTWNFREPGSDGYDFGGQIVEATRSRNVHLVEGDAQLCGEELSISGDSISEGITGHWGGNTPLNLYGQTKEDGNLTIGNYDLNTSIVPLFDIIGSKEVGIDQVDKRAVGWLGKAGDNTLRTSYGSAGNPTRGGTCTGSNYILTFGGEYSPSNTGDEDEGYCEVATSDGAQDVKQRESFDCSTEHEVVGGYNGAGFPTPGGCKGFLPAKANGSSYTFYDENDQTCHNVLCRVLEGGVNSVYYDDWKPDLVKPTKSYAGWEKSEIPDECESQYDPDEDMKIVTHTFLWKTSGDKGREYKSPTQEEIQAQVKAGFTPDLPIDAERYTEFFGKGDVGARIFYPNFFRTIDGNTKHTDQSDTAEEFDVYLEDTTQYINDVLNYLNGHIGGGGSALEEIDLKELLDGGELDTLKKYSSLGETKELSYYVTLLNAIHWYQLGTTSNKYRYVFENYLNDQFDDLVIDTDEVREDIAQRVIPENKKLYEIVYLNTPGDIQNMFVKMSPEETFINPYEQELQDIANLKTDLLSLNTSEENNISSTADGCSQGNESISGDYNAAIACGFTPNSGTISGIKITPDYIPPKKLPEEKLVFDTTLITNLDDVQEIDTSPVGVSGSTRTNLFLYDENKQKYSDIITAVNNANISSQKLLLGVSGYENRDYFELTYPISLDIKGPGGFSYTVNYTRSQLNFFSPVTSLANAGEYSVTITDAQDNVGRHSITVLPNAISDVDLELGSSVIESHGTQIKNHVSLRDVFGNVATGELYNIEVSLDGKSVEFVNTTEKDFIRFQTFTGIQSFVLKSTDNIGTTDIAIKVFDGKNDILLQSSHKIEVVDSLNVGVSRGIRIAKLPDFSVGGESYDIELEMLDKNGAVYEGYNGYADANIAPLYGEIYGYQIIADSETGKTPEAVYENLAVSESSRLEFIAGKAKIQLTTKSSSGKGVPLTLTSPALLEPDIISIDIASGDAMQVDLTLSKQNISTAESDFSIARVELKDRYGNIVTTDNSTEVSLEIPEIYIPMLRSDETTKQVSGGIADFQIYSNGGSGMAFFKATASREGGTNAIEIIGQSPFEKTNLDTIVGMRRGLETNRLLSDLGKLFFRELGPDHYISLFPSKQDLQADENFVVLSTAVQKQLEELWDNSNTYTIDGVDYAVAKINTFYLWKQDTVNAETGESENRRYNGLYSVLLGAPYGDYASPDYLAGELLFDDSNRSLAVTSTLNNPYAKNDIFQIKSSGGIGPLSSSSNLFQDIAFTPLINKDGKLEISIYNNALNIFVGSVSYNISNFEGIACARELTDISDCINTDTSSVVLQSLNDDIISYITEDSTVLKSVSGGKILEVFQDGTWKNYGSIGLEIDTANSRDALTLNINNKGQTIAQAYISLQDIELNTSRNKELLERKQSVLDDTMLIYLSSSKYSNRTIDEANNSVARISYNDSFESNTTLDEFHQESEHGFENSIEYENIGWEDNNKTLLSFSAGKNVGQSVQDYMSFSVINLGDPVVGLYAQTSPTQNDTPEAQVVRGFDSTIGEIINNDPDLEAYQVWDYNNDGNQDVLLIKSDGYLALLENVGASKRFRNRGNIAHIVDMGDPKQIFSGDFTGDGYDDIYFINNKSEPYILNNYKTTFHRVDLAEPLQLIETDVMLTRVFDMDDDTITDIITLDSSGELNIYYGDGTVATIQDESDSRQDPIFTKNNIDSGLGISIDQAERSDGGLIYFDGLYQDTAIGTDSDAINKTSEEVIETFNKNVEILSQPRGRTPQGQGVGQEPDLSEAAKTLIDATLYQEISYDADNELGTYHNNSPQELNENVGAATQTNFIQSQYGEFIGAKVTKQYSPVRSGSIQPGNTFRVDINIKNTSGKKLSNFAYLESSENVFKFDKNSLETSRTDVNIQTGFQGFEFIVDDFDLSAGDEIEISYTVELLPVTYGHLEVGFFEQDTIGDDEYGDIILKDSYKNCSENFTLYSSISTRSYNSETSAPTCHPENNNIPEYIKNNKIDTDGNGIPDYIDNIKKELQSNTGSLQEGDASNLVAAAEKDSDGDGVPDVSDSSPNYNDSESSVDSFNESVDDLSEDVDEIIAGLCNGFGGGGSWDSPLNWAPLAPGNDPTLFGYPALDGLNVDEGFPLFSSITGLQMVCGTTPCCIPAVHPLTPRAYQVGTTCGDNSAGGELGVWSPANTFRLYVTPTLTGAAGVAFCFGGTASTTGTNPGSGVSPLVSGGNCIVAAAPLFEEDDDNDTVGDPASTGPVAWGGKQGNSNFGVIHGNCSNNSQASDPASHLTPEYLQSYLNHKQSSSTTILPPALQKQTRDVLQGVNSGRNKISSLSSRPLLTVGSKDRSSGVVDMSITLDTSKIDEGSFKDVIKIQNKRVSAFPDFLMDWVTRQIEEIATKLTDFPTLFVILPNFDHLGQDDWKKNLETEDQQSDKPKKKPGTYSFSTSQISGIQEAYKFLANVPYINIEEEVVNIDIPWPGEDLFGVTKQWEQAKEQWDDAKEQWLKEIDDTWTDEWSQVNRDNIVADIDRFTRSLDKNIETLESYQEIPERISKLLSIKEQWFTQILANIETVSDLMGGWVYRNGKTFRQWVETYLLIKTLLKSWQLIIDIFKDYSDQCHDCKNERHDLQYFKWKLISIVIPDIPVIIFPKWPDLILDLHNIRVGMNIKLPEFSINHRPLVLPRIPTLDLPSDPNIVIEIPNMPLLPELDIPDLPQVPAIDVFDLPNLPAAPKVTKMLSSFEGILNILKLVTKMMCILKKQPFVPEDSAGDRISFITERSGYLPIDYLDIQLPQYSIPFYDAIKTTSYVNLEYDTEYILEAARAIAAPLRVFSNDLVNKLRINSIDASIGVDIPREIEVDIDNEGNVDVSSRSGFLYFATQAITNLVVYISEHNDDTVSSTDFIELANYSLSKISLDDHEALQTIVKDFETLGNYSFSKEDAFIEELQKNNTQKFEKLTAIIEYEMEQNRLDQQELENGIFELTKPIASNVADYNSQFDVHNARFRDAAAGLVTGENKAALQLQSSAKKLVARVDAGMTEYTDKMYALENGEVPSGSHNSCGGENAPKRNYEGIYVIEEQNNETLAYRLFNYLEELKGDEEITRVDIDGDEDEDIFYFVDGHLYLKYNRTHIATQQYVTDAPARISIGNNKYFNGEEFYEAIDHFIEPVISSNNINVSFDAHANPKINNYRLVLSNYLWGVENQIKSESILFADLESEAQNNAARSNYIIDALSNIDESTLITVSDSDIASPYSIRSNQAHISYVGQLADATLTTALLKDLNDDLLQNKLINIAPDTPVYTGNNSVKIRFVDVDKQPQTLVVPSRSNIVFDDTIRIYSMSGPLYVKTQETVEYEGQNILEYIHLPLLDGSKIIFDDTTAALSEKSRIEIRYYDDAILNLDARYTRGYELYNLTEGSEVYDIRTRLENQYYYSKLSGFTGEINSTISSQTLVAPQLKADTFAPELEYDGEVSIAIGQKQTLDLTNSILEDSGVAALSNIILDMDTEDDSDGDGDPSNDSDVTLRNHSEIPNAEIRHGLGKLNLRFGPYNTPVTKNIRVSLVDPAGNIGHQDISFEVYSPVPEIQTYNGSDTITGTLSEPLDDIEVDVYRYRQGGLSRLDTETIVSQSGGIWTTTDTFTGSGLTLTSSGGVLARIDELSGAMSFVDGALSNISLDSSEPYPKLILNRLGEDVYYQYIHMGTENTIDVISDKKDIDEEGMYLHLSNTTSYGYYSLPSTAPYSPGAVVIYRNSSTLREPLFTLYPDGRIETLNDFYDLEYRYDAHHTILRLIDRNFDREVAEVIYHLGDGYILDGQAHSN